MLDTFFLPTKTGDSDVQIFTIPSTVTNTQWHTWQKPRGKTMAFMLCVGGGGGGGGGFAGAAASARGGGGGGAGSGVGRLTIPVMFLPDILYIQVGAGGLGNPGTTSGAAGSGILSWISVYPSVTVNNILLNSSAAAPTGGGTGTATAAGAVSVGGTIPVITAAPLAGLGQYMGVAGQAGTIGGTITGPGGNLTLPTTSLHCLGGTGGGGITGTAQAGGAVTAVAATLVSEVRPAQAAAGIAGSGGYPVPGMRFVFGGMGGGSVDATPGMSGGNGIYGSGGGGGGGGTTPGGRGGDGGEGYVVIICW